MEPNIGISDANRARVVDLLGKHVADLHILYVKTRNYHWNVTGLRFYTLHIFLEEQYTAIAVAIDQVAERIRQLGGKSPGTLREFVELARLKEEPGVYPDANGMLKNLLTDHESIIRQLRKDVDETADKDKDTGTSDFLTGLMEAHEKMAWMIRAFLEE